MVRRKQGAYQPLSAFAVMKGLHGNLDNLEKVASTMLNTWEGKMGNLHEFISYLEVKKKQWEVEKTLKKIRLAFQEPH